jgi:hypothetical protein
MVKSMVRLLSPAVLVALLSFGLGLSLGSVSARGGGNRCKDRCNDVYRLRKDACKAIPLKHERHQCEKSAKQARNECKHRCR